MWVIFLEIEKAMRSLKEKNHFSIIRRNVKVFSTKQKGKILCNEFYLASG